jgi:hypothetical protein
MTRRSLFALIVAITASTPFCATESPNVADLILAAFTNLAAAGIVMFVDSDGPGMLLAVVRGHRMLVLG